MNQQDKTTELILCIFLGCFGVHKFYKGKIGMGILYLFTCGLFMIGWIVDIVLIAKELITNSDGRELKTTAAIYTGGPLKCSCAHCGAIMTLAEGQNAACAICGETVYWNDALQKQREIEKAENKAADMQTTPDGERKTNSKSLLKKWWFWLIALCVIGFVFGAFIDPQDESDGTYVLIDREPIANPTHNVYLFDGNDVYGGTYDIQNKYLKVTYKLGRCTSTSNTLVVRGTGKNSGDNGTFYKTGGKSGGHDVYSMDIETTFQTTIHLEFIKVDLEKEGIRVEYALIN